MSEEQSVSSVGDQIPKEPVPIAGIPPLPQNPPPSQEPVDEHERAIREFMSRNAQPDDPVNTTFSSQTSDLLANTSPSFTPGQVVSEVVNEKKPRIVMIISSLFFTITFTFTTLSLLLLAVLIALTISLTNAGSPGFLYLQYYPKIGILPVFAAAASVIFLYVAYKLREGSRQAWVMAVLSLATIPATFSAGMPILAYPLVKLVSVYAGTPEKPLLSPALTITQLGQICSVFLLFDVVLILLLVAIRYFRYHPTTLSTNAKTSLAVVCLLFVLPATGVAAYGYYDSSHEDFGYGSASQSVGYQIWYTQDIPGERALSTRYQTHEELAGIYSAVKVVYDVPLPTIIQTGKHSPIILRQVQVPSEFNIRSFISTQERDAGTEIGTFDMPQSANGQGFIIRRGVRTRVFALMPDYVLVEAESDTAPTEDLTHLVGTLE